MGEDSVFLLFSVLGSSLPFALTALTAVVMVCEFGGVRKYVLWIDLPEEVVLYLNL